MKFDDPSYQGTFYDIQNHKKNIYDTGSDNKLYRQSF